MYPGIHKQYYKGHTGIRRGSGICKRSMQVNTGIIDEHAARAQCLVLSIKIFDTYVYIYR
jgi:hypothetical protein